MKEIAMDGDTHFLPQDIISNILKRLLVKSLIRFRCVCKDWKNLFKTPSFIPDHLQHSSHLNPSLLLPWQRLISNDWHFDLLDCDKQLHEFKNASLIDSSQVRIIGSSNGLLCLKITNDGVYSHSLSLWNLATRELRQVPGTINDFNGSYHLQFGFISFVNDYKIVRIYLLEDDYFYKIYRVEVNSLCIGSWKEVEFWNLQGVWVSYKTVTANGTMFWFGLNEDREEHFQYDWIVSFDIAREVFALLPMPAFDSTAIVKLTVYENKLAVLSFNTTGEYEYCVQLWVLEEGTGPSRERWNWTYSWAKNYTSSPSLCLLDLYPATIWRNTILYEAEFEVENDETKSFLYLFNIATNEFKGFAIRKHSSGLGFFNYVESLVSVGNIHIEEP